ncbi:MAG: hypothetical protein WBR29_12920 [Gammaproteobacteria bacterium]
MLLTIMVLILAGPVVADTQPCSTPEYRQLNFWLGNWNAFDDDGKGPDMAQDQISSILGGCVILERYMQNDGHDGESFSIYDTTRHVWHQTWVTNDGELLTLEGHFRNGVLTMYGHNLDKNSNPVWYRATWQMQGQGVREIAYLSNDKGRSWQPDFDILFLHRH